MPPGADLCGVGSMDRFEGVPKEMDPRYIFPEAKSVVGMVFRIPRGVQRGIEEGTQFYQYPSMAYGGINEIYAPAVLYHVGKLIEDYGYEAAVYRNTGARGCVSDMDGTPGNTLSPEEQIQVMEQAKKKTDHHRTVQYTRAAREGQVAPDLQFHFRLAGVACGLGEMGWSKMFLTPEFGPLQRLAFLFTDAPLEPDPDVLGQASLPALHGVRPRMSGRLREHNRKRESFRRRKNLRVGQARRMEVLRFLYARRQKVQSVRAEGGLGQKRERRPRPARRQKERRQRRGNPQSLRRSSKSIFRHGSATIWPSAEAAFARA